MKKILFLTLFGLFTLILSWCGYKTRDEVIQYFNDNYDDFENIQYYMQLNWLYFDCYVWCKNIVSWSDKFIYLWHSIYWNLFKFSELSWHIKQYIVNMAEMLSGDIVSVWYNPHNHSHFGLKDSLFSIEYLLPDQIKNYYWYTENENYFWNITWNWYYDFDTYYRRDE